MELSGQKNGKQHELLKAGCTSSGKDKCVTFGCGSGGVVERLGGGGEVDKMWENQSLSPLRAFPTGPFTFITHSRSQDMIITMMQ